MKKEHQELFQPIRIGGVEIKNRYVMSPMADFGLVDKQGVPTDAGVEYFVRRAQGGIGLILTGVCYVDDEVERIVEHTLMCTPQNSLSSLVQGTDAAVIIRAACAGLSDLLRCRTVGNLT